MGFRPYDPHRPGGLDQRSPQADHSREVDVKKLFALLIVGCIVAAVVAAIKRQAATEPRMSMTEKMQRAMEEMPEDFPPKVMFNNIAAARENTDRILQLLETQRAVVTEPEAVAS